MLLRQRSRASEGRKAARVGNHLSMGETDGAGEPGAVVGDRSQSIPTAAAGDVVDARASSASSGLAAVRRMMGKDARPEDVFLLLSVIDALRTHGVEHALGVLGEAAEGGGQLEDAVLLVPMFETVEIDQSATLASLGPGGSRLNAVLLQITQTQLHKLLLPLLAVLYSVAVQLFWAEQLAAGWVIVTLTALTAVYAPVMSLCNLHVMRVLLGSFETWFLMFQTLTFTFCGMFLFLSATRQALWVIPGLVIYLPSSLIDANPDRSSQALAYGISFFAFCVGIVALCFHLWVFENRVVNVLGFSFSLASRTISAHVSMLVFMANLAWSGFSRPQVLAGRPDISYMWVPRSQWDMRKSKLPAVKQLLDQHQYQDQQHKVVPLPDRAETGLAAVLAVSLRELQAQTEFKSGDGAHAALTELEAIYSGVLHRNRSASTAHRHTMEGLVLLLAPTFSLRRVDSSDTLAALLGGRRLHRALARAFQNPFCRLLADALWPVSAALALAGATGVVEPEPATAATAATLALAVLEVLLAPLEIGRAILFGNALLLFAAGLSLVLAVFGALAMQDARGCLWALLMCLPLLAAFTDALPTVHRGSLRRFLQFPSLALLLWACALAMHDGRVRLYLVPVKLSGGLTLDLRESMLPNTALLALLCTRMAVRATCCRNEFAARVGVGKLVVAPHVAVKLLGTHRGMRDLTMARSERTRLAATYSG